LDGLKEASDGGLADLQVVGFSPPATAPRLMVGTINQLRNGDFSAGTAYWNFEQHAPAVATETVTSDFTNGRPALRIEVLTPGNVSYHVQLNQYGLNLKSGRTYTVSFWAKANLATTIRASLQNTTTYLEQV
jgi:hypothetical protein